MAKMVNYGSNIAGLQRTLRQLPKEVTAELRLAAQSSAEIVAADARGRAASIGRGFRLLGPTITAPKDRVPVIKIGGTRRIPGRKGDRQTVGDLLFGTEFGGGAYPTTRQFLPHLGQEGYALWPAVRDHSDDTLERYSASLLDAIDAAARG